MPSLALGLRAHAGSVSEPMELLLFGVRWSTWASHSVPHVCLPLLARVALHWRRCCLS
jgi:hypothetical protein